MIRQRPATRYALSGDLRIAFQTLGSGDRDIVLVPGFVTHLDLAWDNPRLVSMFERLASFGRLILFDKRGTGLSDPVEDVATLEQRMDDVRAVMDEAGSESATLVGISEGAPMAITFAATYPHRTTALVLYGGMARSTEAPDYPWAAPAEALIESATELLIPRWGEGVNVEIFSPTEADDPVTREWSARMERSGASPGMVQKLFTMFLQIDVRDVLPVIGVPTLVIHRRGDRVVNVRAGRWMAEQIPGARFVELSGIDHVPWAGDQEAVVAEIEEFVTGVRTRPEPRRVLATLMFTDIVGSSGKATELGDSRWHELLDRHHTAVRQELARFDGREVKVLGDGFLARFDGPARAIASGRAIGEAVRGLGLEVRIGVHTGECEVMGDDVGGIAVHIAARIGALAKAGEVVVSGTVKDLVAGSGIGFEDRGIHELRGVPDTWRLFSVAPGATQTD